MASHRERLPQDIDSIRYKLQGVRDDLEIIKDSGEEEFEGMPEDLQESDRGESMKTSLDTLVEVVDDIDRIIGKLEEIEPSFHLDPPVE